MSIFVVYILICDVLWNWRRRTTQVKRLILDLRWRLEQEAQQETNKKVWCDEQLAKAEHERDTRRAEANHISTLIGPRSCNLERVASGESWLPQYPFPN